jgi:hypothetical protein
MKKIAKFSGLKAYLKVIGSSTIAFLAVALVMFFVCVSLTRSVIKEKQAIDRLRLVIGEAESDKKQLAEYETALNLARKKSRLIRLDADTTEPLVNFFDYMRSQAQAQGLNIQISQEAESIVKQAPAILAKDSIRQVPISVSIQGGYRAIGDFIGALLQGPCPCSVKQLKMRRREGIDKIEGSADIVVYFMGKP